MPLVGKVVIFTHSFRLGQHLLALIEAETPKTVQIKVWYPRTGRWSREANKRDKVGLVREIAPLTSLDMPDLSAKFEALKDECTAAERAARRAYTEALKGLHHEG